MGDTQNTANTTNHHTMKRAIVIAASLALVWGAPQFKTDTIRSNCRSEVTTVFEETEAKPVEGSCVSKPTEVCEEMTRFQEEFVDEDRCRDIPIKDCKNVQSEVCSEQQELVCEPQHTEDCQIVPHDECEHIVEKVPKKVSKKITKVVCDENEEGEEPTEA